MLPSRILPAVVLAVTCLLVDTEAVADIYTWLDANGATTVSNLPPPDGARVTRVTHETPAAAASAAAAREAAHQAELQALASRVRELETATEMARQPMPLAIAPPVAPVVYVPVPQPIIVTVQQPEPVAPASGCDPSWFGCFGWGSGFYPTGLFVVPTHPVRARPPFRPDPNIPHRPPPLPHQAAMHPVPQPR